MRYGKSPRKEWLYIYNSNSAHRKSLCYQLLSYPSPPQPSGCYTESLKNQYPFEFLSGKSSNALMALSSCSPGSIPLNYKNPRTFLPLTRRSYVIASSAGDSPRPSLRISTNSNPKARFVSRRSESVTVRQLARPLSNVRSVFDFET